MIGGTAHDRRLEARAGFDDDAAFDARVCVELAVDARLDRVEDEPVAVQQRVLLAGVDPPALEDFVHHRVAVVDQPLDRVGDLELAPRRRLDGRDRLVDARCRRCRRRRARDRTADPRASRRGGRRRRRASISATPNWRGSSTCASRICAAGESRCGSSSSNWRVRAPRRSGRRSDAGPAAACCRRGT